LPQQYYEKDGKLYRRDDDDDASNDVEISADDAVSMLASLNIE
jgi:hypothetical protein